MRVPLNWLSEYVDPGLPTDELATRLAMTGTEVERIHRHGVDGDGFVVGKVLESVRHPDADRLSVCSVDVGDPAGPAQIVCGAHNVAAGQTVAVARPGAVMPDGMKLKKAKLRGVESHGMILAEDELDLGVEHWGIIVLPDGPAPGSPLAGALPLNTDVLELEITPNRPDCLSIYGVAREVHAATGAPLAPPPWADDPIADEQTPPPGIEVRVDAPDLCPRFTVRVFEDVQIGPSPLWLKARLMAAGQRPINNVVDITNYVMLLTGQPLHAFDLDRVEGGALIVRRAEDGEKIETLDGQQRTLDSQMLVIDDAAGPTSIAGVMGGARSEVHEGTTRVAMEVANWVGHNIQRTSTKLNVRSEASARFEKGLAPEQTLEAQIVATKLMIETAGARVLGGTLDVGGPGPDPARVHLRDARTSSLLGMDVPRARAAEILSALGFGVTDLEDGLEVTVPAFRRNDVYREADLIEEVARIYGLEQLPATLPSRRGASGRLTLKQHARRRAQDALIGAGVTEIVGWSFTDPGLADRLSLPPGDPRRRTVAIRNPMSSDQSLLRTTLLGSLLDAARHNAARGMPGVRLWEYGATYHVEAARSEHHSKLPDEQLTIGILLTGRGWAGRVSWRDANPPEVDVFAAKGVLEAMLGALRIPFALEPAAVPFLHPARAADIVIGGERLGWLGEVHPEVAARWDLEGGRVAAFELDLGRALDSLPGTLHYADLTSFPSVRQDIAVVVSEEVPAARVVATVREAGGATLARADVFDVYSGPQVGAGRRSLALALEFRAADRTLTDDEVAKRREKITAALADKLGGELRG